MSCIVYWVMPCIVLHGLIIVLQSIMLYCIVFLDQLLSINNSPHVSMDSDYDCAILERISEALDKLKLSPLRDPFDSTVTTSSVGQSATKTRSATGHWCVFHGVSTQRDYYVQRNGSRRGWAWFVQTDPRLVTLDPVSSLSS